MKTIISIKPPKLTDLILRSPPKAGVSKDGLGSDLACGRPSRRREPLRGASRLLWTRV
jgi:hypothetical protein